ncbi:hypothetical protein Prudu_017215 [Prunus dulcis]|uniref:Uncharacterized protein n=1 Tax=Prunus dulcis TaxID=3755 RepID=A0A4Y1RPG9_PRUDU|nr:hypothetical protein Prudu_017215 [Prunus dulcis]
MRLHFLITINHGVVESTIRTNGSGSIGSPFGPSAFHIFLSMPCSWDRVQTPLEHRSHTHPPQSCCGG